MKKIHVVEIKERKGMSNTVEIIIPIKFLKKWKFHVSEYPKKYYYNYDLRFGKRPPKSQYKTVLNSKGKQSEVYLWINKKRNIELTDVINGWENTNGLFVKKEIHVHGGSCVMSIPFEIVHFFKEKGLPLKWLKLNKKNGNLELEPYEQFHYKE